MAENTAKGKTTTTTRSEELYEELAQALAAERAALAAERTRVAEERAALEALQERVRALAAPAPAAAFVLRLCVGGTPFEVQAGTLAARPTSLLAGLCAQVAASADPAAAMPLYIDRSPTLFPVVCTLPHPFVFLPTAF